jgi:hypothetical protein
LGTEKKSEIAEACGKERCARSLAASDKKVAPAAIYSEKIKRMTRLPCPAQTDAPSPLTCRAEI